MVFLTWTDFSVESQSECNYDMVSVTDGNGIVHGPFCGYDLPSRLGPLQGPVTVEFATDSSQTRTGFRVQYSGTSHQTGTLYSLTPKPSKWVFVNIEKVYSKNQFLMVRFIKVVHPTGYSEI